MERHYRQGWTTAKSGLFNIRRLKKWMCTVACSMGVGTAVASYRSPMVLKALSVEIAKCVSGVRLSCACTNTKFNRWYCKLLIQNTHTSLTLSTGLGGAPRNFLIAGYSVFSRLCARTEKRDVPVSSRTRNFKQTRESKGYEAGSATARRLRGGHKRDYGREETYSRPE